MKSKLFVRRPCPHRAGAPFVIAALAFMSLAHAADSQPSLKQAFQNYFLIGAALNANQFTERDSRSAAIAKAQFNTITPENVLKWESVHPEPDSYNFESGDQYVNFGEKNGMFVIGHTLVWHNQTPRWVFRDTQGNELTRDALLKRLHDHIQTVVGRYKGQIKGWDVVNEALNEDGTMRRSLWLKIIGDDYLQKAFEFAHEADPAAELYYNDFSLENEPKRKGAIELVKKLTAAGVHLKGVGLQNHDRMDWPTPQQLADTIDAFAKLGLQVMITELDVDVLPRAARPGSAEVSLNVAGSTSMNPYTNGLPDSVQKTLAKRYGEIFSVLVARHAAVKRVTFWGVTDADSWLNNWPVRGRTSYPLLFDRNGKPKPAFDAVMQTAVAGSSKAPARIEKQ